MPKCNIWFMRVIDDIDWLRMGSRLFFWALTSLYLAISLLSQTAYFMRADIGARYMAHTLPAGRRAFEAYLTQPASSIFWGYFLFWGRFYVYFASVSNTAYSSTSSFIHADLLFDAISYSFSQQLATKGFIAPRRRRKKIWGDEMAEFCGDVFTWHSPAHAENVVIADGVTGRTSYLIHWKCPRDYDIEAIWWLAEAVRCHERGRVDGLYISL